MQKPIDKVGLQKLQTSESRYICKAKRIQRMSGSEKLRRAKKEDRKKGLEARLESQCDTEGGIFFSEARQSCTMHADQAAQWQDGALLSHCEGVVRVPQAAAAMACVHAATAAVSEA